MQGQVPKLEASRAGNLGLTNGGCGRYCSKRLYKCLFSFPDQAWNHPV